MSGIAPVPSERDLRRLRADPQAARLSPAGQAALAARAQEMGEEAARRVRARFGDLDADALAAALGVRVEDTSEDGGFGSVVVFADYRPRPPAVRLYRRAIAAEEARLRAGPVGPPAPGDCRRAFLAHELFHHWESIDPDCAPARALRIPQVALGPLRITTAVRGLSEIAADAFARCLLGRRHPEGLGERNAA